MKNINTNTLDELSRISAKKTFGGHGKQVSEALGRQPDSMDINKRHPFDVEILRIEPGMKPYPFHSHSAQWEFYHVISGKGIARDDNSETEIETGDAFVFKPGEAHQLINNSDTDLVVYIIADNPIGESCHYPDSEKWLLRSPARKIIRPQSLDYFDGEEI